LYKAQKSFWSTVLEGDEKIDTSLVDSQRHISTYDESTQAQIRKIIWEQQQIAKGLPIPETSDRTSDMLRNAPPIPNLPPGVEYIDQKILDEKTKKK
jgi:GTP1/Obg family GTP-binding protein